MKRVTLRGIRGTWFVVLCALLLVPAIGRASSVKMTQQTGNDFSGYTSFVYNPPEGFEEISCSIKQVDTIDGDYGASLSKSQPAVGDSVTLYVELIDHIYKDHAGAKNLKVAEVSIRGHRTGSSETVEFLTFDVLMDVPYAVLAVSTLTGKTLASLVYPSSYHFGEFYRDSVCTAESVLGYVFVEWTGLAVDLGCTTSRTSPEIGIYAYRYFVTYARTTQCYLYANYAVAPDRTLTISSGQGGTVTTPGEGSFSYSHGTNVTITAVADDGYTFTGWSGTAVSAGKVANPSALTTTVTMDADYTLIAWFIGQTCTLEISSTSGGSVITPGEGTFSYATGQIVMLEAQADAGYHFVNWTGSVFSSSNPYCLETEYDMEIIAYFAPDPPVLTVSAGEGGRVIVPGEGAFVYEPGASVRAIALPDPGYVFAGWTGTQIDSDAGIDLNAGRIDFVIEANGTLHAGFAPVARSLYVNDDGDTDPSWDDPLISDPAEDGTWEHPFDSVQEAIDAADTGDAILVLPGIYREHLSFRGKGIMVSSFDPCSVSTVSQTILAGTDANSVVVFDNGESPASILVGFTVVNGRGQQGGGICCYGADPIIANCLIAGNRADVGGGLCCLESRATVVNCTVADNVGWIEAGGLYCDDSVTVINSIIYGNKPEQIVDALEALSVVYSAVEGGWSGDGNIDGNPYFAEPGHWALLTDPDVSVDPSDPESVWISGDYHLKSEGGRWDGLTWMIDSVTSPCIDAGLPEMVPACESTPHGDRINMGAFGGTAEASHSRP